MEDHILPPYFQILARLLPDHLARNERIQRLLTEVHDAMIDKDEARLLLNVYRRFMTLLLTENHDPTLTERVRDAFVEAVTDSGATLSAQSSFTSDVEGTVRPPVRRAKRATKSD